MTFYPKSTGEAHNMPAAYDPDSALGRVVMAIAELKAQPNCVLCGRPFTENAISPDHCARCAAERDRYERRSS